MVQPKFIEPIGQVTEHLEAPGFHADQHVSNAGLNTHAAVFELRCHLTQARANDGWRCDRDERAGQAFGFYAAPAGRRGR
jgi:hypothetical protein